MEVSLGNLETTSEEHLHYWLLAIKTKGKAKLLWEQQEQQQTGSGETMYGTGQVTINFQHFYEVRNVFHIPPLVCLRQTFLSHAAKDCRVHEYVKKRVVLSYVVLLQCCLALCPQRMKTP